MKTEIWKEKVDKTLGSSVPENYERFFVPVIGRPVAEELIRKSSIQPGEKVLDVACGTGIIARLALKRTGKDGKVTGIDINGDMLETARSANGTENHIEWIEGSAENIPLPDESYDVVLCQLGLQFMQNKMAALSEMRRVLIPGGRIFLNVPGPVEFLEVLDQAIARHINPEAAGFVSQVYSLYKTAELRRLMRQAAFSNISIDEKHQKLTLPAAKDFLWQYIYGTPLAGLFLETGEDDKKALEDEVVRKWQKYTENGGMRYDQHLLEVSAHK